jgi:hypothetical protein
MTRREIQELETGAHPELNQPRHPVSLFIDGRESALDRLKAARDACDATADMPYEVQAFVSAEMVDAKAVAQEWMVCR